ncbi:MAG: MucB/RseB C-terminal domain-containing protein [Betaproteobacteria bacterium]
MKQRLGWLCASVCALALHPLALAQPTPVAAPSAMRQDGRDVAQWLMRMHEASRHRTYAGTFVVSSANGDMSSSRIWHACDGQRQVERIEALTGAPRTTFRYNDQVVTFLPQSRQVLQERRESLRLFPELLKSPDAQISDYYFARFLGSDRVAGVDADVMLLAPRDRMRFGYRIWSEKETGLLLKLQTLDTDGRTLEQSAFSELQLNANVNIERLIEMMGATQGYSVQRLEPVSTSTAAQGWVFRSGVAGFRLMSCLLRPTTTLVHEGGTGAPALQWAFSDGLASVSLFAQPLDRPGPAQEVSMVMGATRLLSRRVQDWVLTAVGEVPLQTLQALSRSLERSH